MIRVKDLDKEFNNFKALKGINIHVRTGEVYGFIGPNGAGKTTTMNILAGLSRPTRGECVVNGRDITKLEHPGDLCIGYLPEDPKFYPWMTARETLLYLSGKKDADRVLEILHWIGLSDAGDRRIGGFSRGMKQRLGIGAAIIRNPELFILDEPSSALDPEGRSDVIRLIKDLKAMGKTILLSTHILDDLERVCDTIGMISDGMMLFEKPLAQLQKEYEQPVYDIMPYSSVDADTINALKQLDGVVSVNESAASFSVKVVDCLYSKHLLSFFAEHDVFLEYFALRKTRLEDLFLKEVKTK